MADTSPARRNRFKVKRVDTTTSTADDADDSDVIISFNPRLGPC